MTSLNQNVIHHKIGLLNLATELGNVSKACKVMGLSRDTFYRYQNAVATGGVEALFEANRKKPNPKNRVEEATEAACATDWFRFYHTGVSTDFRLPQANQASFRRTIQ